MVRRENIETHVEKKFTLWDIVQDGGIKALFLFFGFIASLGIFVYFYNAFFVPMEIHSFYIISINEKSLVPEVTVRIDGNVYSEVVYFHENIKSLVKINKTLVAKCRNRQCFEIIEVIG